MQAGDPKPELVEPATNLAGVVAVQLEQLDALVALGGDRPQRPLEVACALVAHGVEHQADAAHSSPFRARKPRTALWVSPESIDSASQSRACPTVWCHARSRHTLS